MKKFILVLLVSILMSSCFDNNGISSFKNSKIYLISFSNDYSNLSAGTLPECNNDYYAIISQLYSITGGKNIESLSFVSQLSNEFVLEGFDSANFKKAGILLPSYSSFLMRPGMWSRAVDSEIRGFRIGKPNMTADEFDDENNWGAKILVCNPSSSQSLHAKYFDNYSIYSYTIQGDSYIYTKIFDVEKDSIFPATFTSRGLTLSDESLYGTGKNYRNISGLLSGYSRDFEYILDDDNSENFVFHKCISNDKTLWRWKNTTDEPIEGVVDAQDKISSWLAEKNISRDDLIIVFYSGHGGNSKNQDEDEQYANNGQLVILSHAFQTDTNSIGTTSSYAKRRDFLDLFDSFDCHKFYIIDSCYSGAFVDEFDSDLTTTESYDLSLYNDGDDSYYYVTYAGENNIKSSIFSGFSNSRKSKYSNSWIISGSTKLNTSYAGLDTMGGCSHRFSTLSTYVAEYLGYDTKNAASKSSKRRKYTVSGMYGYILDNFPLEVRELKNRNAQNPMRNNSVVDLIIF